MNLKAHRFGAILTERKQTHSVVLMSLACDICETESHLVVSDSLRPHVLYSPWNSLGQNTGVGILSLLLMAQWVKNPPAVQETQEMWVQSLGREDPLEEEMATHSSILAWRIP